MDRWRDRWESSYGQLKRYQGSGGPGRRQLPQLLRPSKDGSGEVGAGAGSREAKPHSVGPSWGCALATLDCLQLTENWLGDQTPDFGPSLGSDSLEPPTGLGDHTHRAGPALPISHLRRQGRPPASHPHGTGQVAWTGLAGNG